LERGGAAIVALIDALKGAKEAGVPAERLEAAQRLQRRSQWRLDYVAAENSMGFHAPQETARILAEAIDYARQGELVARGLVSPPPAAPAGETDARDAGTSASTKVPSQPAP
jgi:nitrite reductase (cytochrome c-552)